MYSVDDLIEAVIAGTVERDVELDESQMRQLVNGTTKLDKEIPTAAKTFYLVAGETTPLLVALDIDGPRVVEAVAQLVKMGAEVSEAVSTKALNRYAAYDAKDPGSGAAVLKALAHNKFATSLLFDELLLKFDTFDAGVRSRIFSALKAAGANANEMLACRPRYFFPMQLAIEVGSAAAVGMLLDAGGVKVNTTFWDSIVVDGRKMISPTIPLEAALRHSSNEATAHSIIAELLARGVDVNKRGVGAMYGKSMLRQALLKGYFDVAKQLVDNGAIPNNREPMAVVDPRSDGDVYNQMVAASGGVIDPELQGKLGILTPTAAHVAGPAPVGLVPRIGDLDAAAADPNASSFADAC